jgi:predicted dehydrogenase
MLARENLDLVAICNNNGERAAAIIACLQRNLDVIAEKPLALKRADLEKIKRLVGEEKTRLGMLLPMRFSPPYLAVKKVVDEGLVGEVAQIGGQKSYQLGTRPAWFLRKSTYGGTIPWIGIHMIDLMRWTSGREFREAASFQSRVAFPELGEMENVTASIFKLDNGGVAALRMDFLRPATAPGHGDDRLRLAGTRGVVEYQADSGRVTVMTDDRKPYVVETLPPAGSVFLDFLGAAYNGSRPSLTLTDIFKVNEITLAAQEAAEQRKLIAIPG